MGFMSTIGKSAVKTVSKKKANHVTGKAATAKSAMYSLGKMFGSGGARLVAAKKKKGLFAAKKKANSVIGRAVTAKPAMGKVQSLMQAKTAKRTAMQGKRLDSYAAAKAPAMKSKRTAMKSKRMTMRRSYSK